MMKDFRDERGSITIFVLASCLFFLVSVTGVQVYTKNKQIALEEDYIQIKKSYEKDLDNQENIYNNVKDMDDEEQSGEIKIDFQRQEGYIIPTESSGVTIYQKFTITNDTNEQIESIMYGWSDNKDTAPQDWETAQTKLLSHIVHKKDVQEGEYYLWVKVINKSSNQEILKTEDAIIVSKVDILINRSDANAVITYPGEVTLYNKKVGQGETKEDAKANLVHTGEDYSEKDDATVVNLEINDSTKVIYTEATDSHGNKIYSSLEI